jgi:hypothetical protein
LEHSSLRTVYVGREKYFEGCGFFIMSTNRERLVCCHRR